MYCKYVYVRGIAFRLGAYGDVLRVKIIFTKKNTALVQMADVQQAHTGQ